MTTQPNRHAEIVIVEDERDIRDMLSYSLRSPSTIVHTAANTGDAFDICKRHAIDLVITDLKMPGTNGIANGIALVDEVNSLYQEHERPQCTFFVVTGYDVKDLEDAYLRGVDEVITKPIDLDRLAALIKEYIGIELRP